LRIGFVRLIDAAPLIVAERLGYFSEQGIEVELEPQFNWVSMRDNLCSGILDSALAVLGSPIMSQLGRAGFVEPLVGVMNVGAGGDSIVISRDLADAGVVGARSLGELVRARQLARKLVCAHTSPYSVNHYLLREWLGQGGLDPDRDVQLTQITTAHAADHLSKHYVDVFCIAEPWGTLSAESGWGKILCATADVAQNHPEKLLVATETFAQRHDEELVHLIRAILKACRYCQEPSNRKALASLLYQSGYLNQEPQVIEASLAIDAQGAGSDEIKQSRLATWQFRTWADEYCRPSQTGAAWFINQMVRWGELSDQVDVNELARRSMSGEFFQRATNAPGMSFAPTPTLSSSDPVAAAG